MLATFKLATFELATQTNSLHKQIRYIQTPYIQNRYIQTRYIHTLYIQTRYIQTRYIQTRCTNKLIIFKFATQTRYTDKLAIFKLATRTNSLHSNSIHKQTRYIQTRCTNRLGAQINFLHTKLATSNIRYKETRNIQYATKWCHYSVLPLKCNLLRRYFRYRYNQPQQNFLKIATGSVKSFFFLKNS